MQIRQVVEYIIENFQSHLKTVVKPAPGGQVTTIVGPSRNGKSAIFRALRKLYYNQPEGTGFIRIGADWCRITAVFDDGYRVMYYRTRGGISRYTVIDPDGNKQEYNDGKSVPLEVQEILLVSPVTVGDLTINLNLAEQLDGPFLGSKSISAPARAKIIGKLAGTEEMDYAGKQLGTDIYRAKQEEKRLEERITALKAQVQEYDYLEDLEIKTKALEVQLKRAREMVEIRNKLTELATQRQVLQIKIRGEVETFIGTGFVEPAEQLVNQLVQDDSKLGKVQSLYQQRQAAINGIAQAEQVLTETEQLEQQAGRSLETATVDIGTLARVGSLAAERTIIGGRLADIQMVLGTTGELAKAEQMVAEAGNKLSQGERLQRLWADRQCVCGELSKAVEMLESTETIPGAETVVAEAETLGGTLAKLTDLLSLRQDVSTKITGTEQILAETEGLAAVDRAVGTAQAELEKVRQLNPMTLIREDFAKRIAFAETEITTLGVAIEQGYESYCKCLKEAGKCPTCGGEVEFERIKEVV